MNSAIDIHVHLAAIPDGKNGCYISPKMLNGTIFRSLLKRLGLSPDTPSQTNEQYIQRLVGFLKSAKHVKRAVLLGMDGVYDRDGVLDEKETHFLVANDYVIQVAKRFPEQCLIGASINPQRKGAIEELHRMADAGAALVKIIPNSQQFDPANPAYKPFWKAMVQRDLPLLCHMGYEFTLWGKDQSVGDPRRLKNALDEGVTVVAAHGASYGLFFYEKYWDTLLEYVRRYPHFYWDSSALSLPTRVGMLMRLRRRPELHPRMIFGTDYPLSSFAYPALLAGKISGYFELRKITNPFDRHYRLLQMLGIQPRSELFHG